MKIIIAGIGKAGNAIMRQLLNDGHTLTVIDRASPALDKIVGNYDALTVLGNCLDSDVLEQADIAKANLLISFTGSDEVNLLCCLLARKLSPRIHTIPRIRNPEYLRLSTDLREELGISMVVNPDRDAAREIYMLMQFPAFLKRETFAKGRVEIVQLRVKPDSKLNKAVISNLPSIMGCKILVCAVVHGGKAFVPKGDDVLECGDDVYVTAPNTVLSLMIRKLGLAKKIKHIMIVGGDRISVYLAHSLADSGSSVKIIENDPARSSQLSASLPHAIVITGDGASQDTLDREGCDKMDALVTLTGLDEVNMIVSMYGASLGVSKVITKINRIESPALLSGLNVGSVVSSTHISSEIIAQYARAMEMKAGSALTVHSIVEGQVEAMEFVIEKDSEYINTPLKDIPMRPSTLLSCITHKGSTIIPDGSSVYRVGDTVIVVATGNEPLLHFNDIFND